MTRGGVFGRLIISSEGKIDSALQAWIEKETESIYLLATFGYRQIYEKVNFAFDLPD